MVAAPLRIVFFGTPEFAVPSLEALVASEHPVVGVVTQPDRPRGRGQKPLPPPVKLVAERLGVPVLQPEKLRPEAFMAQLRGMQADLGVVAAYGKILPADVLATPRLGMINVHASLLPRYRGAAPVHRAVMAGEHETGVTIMRVVEALDAGPMLLKAARPIGDHETSLDVERGLAQLGAGLLIEAVDALRDGRAVETAQDDRLATYAAKIVKSDGQVDWTRPASDIHNQIRGLHPWPHAFSLLDGERIILHGSQVERELPAVEAEPGTVFEAHGERLTVSTGRGALRLTRLQREGKRAVSAREFLAGRPVQPGARFAPADA